MDTSDPRVGSARDNSTSPGASRLIAGSNSSSGTSLLATIVPVLIWTVLCIAIFVVLRRKCPRVYSPRSFLKSLEPHERSAALPTGWFDWFRDFYRIPSTSVLNHSSLDGYLFLRFLKVLCLICLVGMGLLWPVLLPLHATGGGGNTELDLLTLGNVVSPNRLYAHAILAWVYFVFVLYTVSRECIYYINLRQAYLLSPYYAHRLSSRTVLYLNVPRPYLDENRLRWVLGKSVKRVWIPQTTDELERLVKEREQTAMRLEKAEFTLIRIANAARAKVLKNQSSEAVEQEKTYQSSPTLEDQCSDDADHEADRCSANAKDVQVTGHAGSPAATWKSTCESERTLPDVNGSVAAQWLSHKARPHHRPIANYGRRVDTIKWTRTQLRKLNSRIAHIRRQQLFSNEGIMPSVFVEFETHTDAQNAYQTLTHHRPLHMSYRYLGVRPFEILWGALRMSWWEKIVRRFSINALITALIIFWAIPSALVGSISNIEYLSDKVPFLGWIADLPGAIKGIISGILPAAALALLMSIVPGILRFCAKVAGIPTLTLIELFVQNAYFAFQVVQVFLITTLTSAASAAVTKLLEDPTTAKDLLSQNLPKASNFYLSYFLVQSFANGSGALLQFTNLFRFHVAQKFSKNPRKVYTKWHRLQRVHWGSLFPVYTNLGVITLTYALIAPVILGFAAIGAAFLHLIYRYNLMYVYDSEIDTRGLVYPRALLQMLLGLYFSEVCMIGLFSLRGAFVPVVLTAILLVVTALVHMSLLDALGPLLWSLPKTLTAEEDQQHLLGGDAPQDRPVVPADPDDFGQHDYVNHSTESVEHIPGDTRVLEGAPATLNAAGGGFKTMIGKKMNKDLPEINVGLNALNSFWMRWISPHPAEKSNFLLRWLHPEVYTDYTIIRQMVPADFPEPAYPSDLEEEIYYPPSYIARPPNLWIPRDPAGVSQQEVEHSGKIIPTTDEHVIMDEKGNLEINLEDPRLVFDIDRLRY